MIAIGVHLFIAVFVLLLIHTFLKWSARSYCNGEKETLERWDRGIKNLNERINDLEKKHMH